jgi:hypothetical protein
LGFKQHFTKTTGEQKNVEFGGRQGEWKGSKTNHGLLPEELMRTGKERF